MRDGVEITRFYNRNTGSEFRVERKDLFIEPTHKLKNDTIKMRKM